MRQTQKQAEGSWNGLTHRALRRNAWDFDLAVAHLEKFCGSGCANYALENRDFILAQSKHGAHLRAERGVRVGHADPRHNNINI